ILMLKNKIYKVLVAIVMCMACFVNNSRAQVLPGVKNGFAADQNSILREKLFVHINKGFYLTGEILWFKIYCADGSTNKPLDLSKVAYLELLDNNHSAVMQTKVALNGGTGSGSLYLPFSLSNGNYQLRAYTSWMKNFDADYFFESQVAIVNPLKTSITEIKQAPPAYDLQFFPEGGQLVKGLTSKVAFKITGPDGIGVPCTGTIINQKNDTIARFKSLNFGMGSFTLRPAAAEIYKAVVKINNTVTIKELPQINTSGYVMRVNDSAEKCEVTVNNSDSSLTSTIYVIVHNRNTIKLAEGSRLVNGAAHFNIDKNKIADGVNIVTLFDEQKRPVCERLIFKRPVKKLFINAGADKPVYETREKVNLSIATLDQNSKGIPANLSVSVFRADALQNKDENHIAGYLWLRADLKGYIESPDYYLENNTSLANEALDNLMLSQGWTQFDKSKIAAIDTPRFKFLPEYTGPIITGYIKNTTNNRPATGIATYLTIPGKPDQLYIAKSDSAGKLLFNTQNFYGSREIVVQTNSQQDSTYLIEIANPFDERHGQTKITAFSLNGDMQQALADNSLNMQVVNIFSKDKLKQFYDSRTDSIPFYGKADKTYMLEDYTRFTSMEEVLREYVGSIAVFKRQGKFGIKAFNVDKLLGQPLILIDGVPVFDRDKIFKVDPLKIRKLEMVTKNYLYGPAFFNGIMSFSSYKGDRANFEIDPNTVVLDYEGLQQERKFYSPVYDSNVRINSTIPDFRTALYWDPNVNTSHSGKVDLNFYTGDKQGKYIGIIEGIAGNGETGSEMFYFEVKK
ncbi:MAG TPA: hypothetical protein VFE54_13480, partial [Mucilaginibacter sp.]|nr:hypothetical protein [Mucilaginibacter sp.]